MAVRFPVVIRLHHSRILPAIVIGVVVLVGLAMVAWLPDFRMAVVAGLLASVVAIRALRDLRAGPTALVFLADGGMQIEDRSDPAHHRASLLPGCIAHPWLAIVRYRFDGMTSGRVLVAVDSLAREDFRRLRVLLRCRSVVSEPGDAR